MDYKSDNNISKEAELSNDHGTEKQNEADVIEFAENQNVDSSENENNNIENNSEIEIENPEVRRSTRPSNIPDRYTGLISYYYLLSKEIPQTYEEATDSENSDKWKNAMDAGLQSIKEKNTWEIVQSKRC